jgi:hypothetical protein
VRRVFFLEGKGASAEKLLGVLCAGGTIQLKYFEVREVLMAASVETQIHMLGERFHERLEGEVLNEVDELLW